MLLIRADGNAKTGAGHMMRCLTVAAAYARGGQEAECRFVCADEASAALAGQNGFPAEVLGTDYRDMEAELPAWERLAQEGRLTASRTVILVDSYYVTDAYLEGLRRYGAVALLDDMAKQCYPVDLVINYNAFADREEYRTLYRGRETALLTGSGYVPLREQFVGRSYRVREQAQTVLVTTGGGDAENIAGKLFELLYREGMQFFVVVGPFSPHLDEWRRQEAQCPGLCVCSNVEDMAGLMCRADIAVTAGGSTIYELAALGVPFLCFSYAENQEKLTEYIGRQGIGGFAGAYHKDREQTLRRMRLLFGELAADAGLRRRYSDAGKRLADGQGADRLAQALREL